jgi:mono/diheme cytochrome c family protein
MLDRTNSQSEGQRLARVALFAALLLTLALPDTAQAGNAQEGQKVFQEKCVRCHNDDGSGTTVVGKALGAADLRSADVQKKTDADFYTQIDKGKGNMPPFGSDLTKPQIDELIAYVRQLAKKQVAAKKH